MKRTFNFVFLILLFISSSVTAQVGQQEYYEAINYCACKIVNAYAYKYAESNSESKESAAYINIIKPALDNCRIGEAIEYSDLKSLLKSNEFGELEGKISPVFDKLKLDFGEAMNEKEVLLMVLSGIYDNRTLEQILEKYPNIKNDRGEIEKDLQSFFGIKENLLYPIEEKDNTSTDNISSNANQQLNNSRIDPSLDNSGNSFSVNWLSIALILITALVLTLIRVYFDKKSRNEMESKIKKLEIMIKSATLQSNSTRESDNFGRYKTTFDNQIKDLKVYIEKLQDDLKIIENNKIKSNLPVIERTRSNVDEVAKSYTKQFPSAYYASAPNADGSFKISSLSSDTHESKTFYKIIVNSNDVNNATFEFFNTEGSVKRATNTPEHFINPVCEAVGVINQNASSIVTIKSGKVRRDGDFWVLIEKAEIKYG